MSNKLKRIECGPLRRHVSGALLLVVAAATAESLLAATVIPPRYELIDIGASLGSYNWGSSINQSGHVTGTYWAGTGRSRSGAFLWDGSSMRDIGNLGYVGPNGDTFATGVGINDSGHIMGVSYLPDGSGRPFLWDGIGMTALQLAIPGGRFEVWGINIRDQIVGAQYYANGSYRPTMWDSPASAGMALPSWLPTIVDQFWTTSVALAINDAGTVAGIAVLTAVSWGTGTVPQLVGTPLSSAGNAINRNGHIAGVQWGSGYSVPFLWEGAQKQMLAGYGNPRGINNLDWVVGDGIFNTGTLAALWIGDQQWNLNDLVVGSGGMTLVGARAINDAGMITGYGEINGETHAFLLKPLASTPAPEPSTLALAGTALAVIAWNRRKALLACGLIRPQFRGWAITARGLAAIIVGVAGAFAQHPGSYIPAVIAGGGSNEGIVVSPLEAALQPQITLTQDRAGNILLVESSDFSIRVRRLGTDGQLRTLTTGRYLPNPFSRIRRGANPQPFSIVARPDGTPLLAKDQRQDPSEGPTSSSYRILQLDPTGTLVPFAGTGTRGYADGPVASAQFSEITALAIDTTGNLFVADDGNFRIRRISTTGVVSTVAGTGVRGSQGDGGAAVLAQIGPVGGLAWSNGELYFTQPAARTIRRIRVDGVMETVAGDGTTGVPTDGSDARKAPLLVPSLVTSVPGGRLVFMDGPAPNSFALVWRMLDATGRIWTVLDPDWGSDFGAPVTACLDRAGQMERSLFRAFAGLTADSAGNLLTVAWDTTARVQRMAPTPLVVRAEGVVNAASYGTAMSPGGLFVAYGSGLGPNQLVSAAFDANGMLPTELGGTRIFFDDLPAPLFYAGRDAVAGFMPYGAADGGKQVCAVMRITRDGQSSLRMAKRVFDEAPGIFTKDYSGTGQAAAFNIDNTANTPDNPAIRGSVIVFFVTGLGVTNPPSVDGQQTVPPNLPKPALPVDVEIGGQPARIDYVGAVPFSAAGVFQVNAVIPPNVTAGPKVEVNLMINGVATANFVAKPITIAVR